MHTLHSALACVIEARGRGYPAEALSMVRQILEQAPDSADAHHLLGMLEAERGHCQPAESEIRQAIRLSPETAQFYSNLGNLLSGQGRPEEAVECFERATGLAPHFWEARVNLGNALQQISRFSDAEAQYRQAAEEYPTSAEIHNGLGNALLGQDRVTEAVASFEIALRFRPGYPEALANLATALERHRDPERATRCMERVLVDNSQSIPVLGRLLEVASKLGCADQAGRLKERLLELTPSTAGEHAAVGRALLRDGHGEDAIRQFEAAFRLDPENVALSIELALAYQSTGRLGEAEAILLAVVDADPGNWEALTNLSALLIDKGDYGEAELRARQALEIKPDAPAALVNLGNVLVATDCIEQAAAVLRRALEIDSQHAAAHTSLGTVMHLSGQTEEALAQYESAIAIQPGMSTAHLNRGLTLLLLGRFEEGWKEYTWRWRTRGRRPREFSQPCWDGGPLAGKTVLLHAEQGLGDTLQFVRYAELVKQRGGTVFLECQPALLPLIETVAGVDSAVPAGAPLPPFDCHAPLLDLPRIFGTNQDTIPAPAPYLKVPEAWKEVWKWRTGAPGRRRIGLVWAAGWSKDSDPRRSLQLSLLARLAFLPDVALFALQRGPEAEQLFDLPGSVKIVNLEEGRGDVLDTAAAILNLDLIISVDTMVAHLAGALGKPVWTLLPYAPDWRWQLGRVDTPWYPTMRLFRQARPGDWSAPIAAMEKRLSGGAGQDGPPQI